MPLEQAIREFRFAYGVDAETRQMRQPPGALALDSMPPALADLFRRAFLTTNRPGPREWIGQLDALSKALKKCYLHSGHYYYRELHECPWCGIEKQARVRLFKDEDKVPQTNLIVSLLGAAGVPIERLGDSTGPMRELSGL